MFASDEDNGYATIGFPSVSEAIRAGDWSLTRDEISDLAERFRAAASRLAEARTALTR